MSRIFGSIIQNGYVVGHSGTVGGRDPFVYWLTEAHPGTIVELLDMSGGRRRIVAGIAAAAGNRDGRDPIRTTLPMA